MVRTSNGDFYLYEPVQLESDCIVVPLFFYSADSDLWAKCVNVAWITEPNGTNIRGTIPAHLSFDSDQLEAIPISHFACNYQDIVDEDNVPLSERCRGALYGVFLFNKNAVH
jgi:hypothetical protein